MLAADRLLGRSRYSLVILGLVAHDRRAKMPE
jgi:hypothetical protein